MCEQRLIPAAGCCWCSSCSIWTSEVSGTISLLGIMAVYLASQELLVLVRPQLLLLLLLLQLRVCACCYIQSIDTLSACIVDAQTTGIAMGAP
jgi:hypothetical protein